MKYLDHLLHCNCTTDLDLFYVLATDVSKLNLLLKESLLIKHDNPVLNEQLIHSLPNYSTNFYYHCFLVCYQILLLLYPGD